MVSQVVVTLVLLHDLCVVPAPKRAGVRQLHFLGSSNSTSSLAPLALRMVVASYCC